MEEKTLIYFDEIPFIKDLLSFGFFIGLFYFLIGDTLYYSDLRIFYNFILLLSAFISLWIITKFYRTRNSQILIQGKKESASTTYLGWSWNHYLVTISYFLWIGSLFWLQFIRWNFLNTLFWILCALEFIVLIGKFSFNRHRFMLFMTILLLFFGIYIAVMNSNGFTNIVNLIEQSFISQAIIFTHPFIENLFMGFGSISVLLGLFYFTMNLSPLAKYYQQISIVANFAFIINFIILIFIARF